MLKRIRSNLSGDGPIAAVPNRFQMASKRDTLSVPFGIFILAKKYLAGAREKKERERDISEAK